MISNALVRIFTAFESKPVLDTFAKEIAGTNAPRIGTTQTKDELFDTSVSELGNTAGLAIGGYGVDRAAYGLFKATNRTGPWRNVGSSLAIYSGVFAALWAMPFIRNYFTAKYRGKTNFDDIINQKATTPQKTAELHQNMADYRRKALTILGLGGAGIATGLLLGLKKSPQLPGWLNTLYHGKGRFSGLGLKDGSFTDFTGLKAVLFWGVPGYAGWMHASRGDVELKEWMLKFGVFVTGFWAIPKLIGKLFNRKLAEHFKPLADELKNEFTYKNLKTLKEVAPEAAQKAQKWLNIREVSKLGISILVLGAGVQMINVLLREGRTARKHHQEKQPQPIVIPRPMPPMITPPVLRPPMARPVQPFILPQMMAQPALDPRFVQARINHHV